jgi:hypothetical protein
MPDRQLEAMHGAPAGVTCPDGGGALWEIEEGRLKRYKCLPSRAEAGGPEAAADTSPRHQTASRKRVRRRKS